MSKNVVGFDLGNSFLKIAVKKNKAVHVHTIPMPDNLIKEGLVIYPAMMIDFLKDLKKDFKPHIFTGLTFHYNAGIV